MVETADLPGQYDAANKVHVGDHLAKNAANHTSSFFRERRSS